MILNVILVILNVMLMNLILIHVDDFEFDIGEFDCECDIGDSEVDS